ncbi:MAG: co-chaperone GroES [Myxococcota bacterium]|jgi:chaperonin GroES|nr:co-chaperone GroES [Myxococcota bacterium]
MNIRPLHDRVVVRRVEGDEQTASGLYIPDSAQEKQARGEVVVAGPGRTNDKGELRSLSVNDGDQILFSKYSGTEIKLDGEDLIILREDDILAVVEA